MTYNQYMINQFRQYALQIKYSITFILLVTPLVMVLTLLRNQNPLAFHAGLYFTGWLSWTFLEYMLHRFWQHGHHDMGDHFSITLHQNHHKHPNEIKITMKQRILLGFICIAIFGLSVLFDNYFSILPGIVFGFTFYTYMHWLLHRRWTASVFPRLHQYHIYHHCKYPHHCHGISVPWWDILFKTTPPEDKKISEKITSFYYGK